MSNTTAMQCTLSNPCGGQSCIVQRRAMGAFVHEDEIMREAGLPVRETCASAPTPEQEAAMEAYFAAHSGAHAYAVPSGPPEPEQPEPEGRAADPPETQEPEAPADAEDAHPESAGV